MGSRNRCNSIGALHQIGSTAGARGVRGDADSRRAQSRGVNILIEVWTPRESGNLVCAHDGVAASRKHRKLFFDDPRDTSQLPIGRNVHGQLSLFFGVKVTNRQHMTW
jgi:hypothetical protein